MIRVKILYSSCTNLLQVVVESDKVMHACLCLDGRAIMLPVCVCVCSRSCEWIEPGVAGKQHGLRDELH